MFGFRFFWTLSMALCVGMLHWGQAYAANAAASDLWFVAAANVPPEQAKKRQSESKASKANAMTIGKQTKSPKENAAPQTKKNAAAKAATVPKKNKTAVKPATDPPHGKASARPAGKHEKHAHLPPASAELPQIGIASWVGRSFHGKPVAVRGEIHAMESFTAAHRAISFHSILKVTDMRSGRSVLVRVNDRGPYIRNRIIDLSRGAAEYLGYMDRGLTKVRVELAGNDKDPALRYYIRMQPSDGPRTTAPVRGFGPFDKFDEAASLFACLYKSYPNAELMAVREQS